MSRRSSSHQLGLGAIAAVVVLVILSSIAAAVVRMGWVEQSNFSQDILGARASQAAYAGVEWGMFQALQGSWTSCASASQNIDMISTMGFMVTVTCNSTLYNEGESSAGTAQTVRLFTIEAVACTTTSSSSCPDASRASGINYVERKRQAQLTSQ